MYTEHLREFVTLARRLNFTATSASLGMSQPSLSRHIAELERYFGTSLIDRGDPLSLTYAGEVLLDEATSLLEREDELKARVALAKDVRITELRIQDWRYSHKAMAIVRAAAASLCREQPEARTRFVNVEYGVNIPEAVLSGAIDVGILAHTSRPDPCFEEQPGIGVLPLASASSRLCFFAGAASPLAGRDEVGVADLRGQTVIVPLIPECANIRSDLVRLCEPCGFLPSFGSTTLSNLDDFFCMDLGSGVMIGIEEYLERGFKSCGTHMARCSEDVYVTCYLLFNENSTNPLLGGFLNKVRALSVPGPL